MKVGHVYDSRQDQGQDRQKGQNWEDQEKQKLEHRKHGNTLVELDGTRRPGNRQTENAGINTQAIMRGDGRHQVGGGDKHKYR